MMDTEIDDMVTGPMGVPAGQTPYALARALPELWNRREKLDMEALRQVKGTREKNMADDAFEAVQFRTMAIQKLILETPSESLADAAAQLLCAYSDLDVLGDPLGERVRRALISAFYVVSEFAGIKPEEIGFEYLAPYCTIPPRGTFLNNP